MGINRRFSAQRMGAVAMKLFALFCGVVLAAFSAHAQAPFALQDRAFLSTTSPFRKDLAAYWRLEESTGTRFDRSKNGNQLTPTGTPSRLTGISGFGAAFGGADALTITANSNLKRSTSDR